MFQIQQAVLHFYHNNVLSGFVSVQSLVSDSQHFELRLTITVTSDCGFTSARISTKIQSSLTRTLTNCIDCTGADVWR